MEFILPYVLLVIYYSAYTPTDQVQFHTREACVEAATQIRKEMSSARFVCVKR